MKDLVGREIKVGDLIAWCYQPNDCRPIMVCRPVIEEKDGELYYADTLGRKRKVTSQCVVAAGKGE